MTIGYCDNCGENRPGCSATTSCGVEGFICYACRGDVLDPYGELEPEDDKWRHHEPEDQDQGDVLGLYDEREEP